MDVGLQFSRGRYTTTKFAAHRSIRASPIHPARPTRWCPTMYSRPCGHTLHCMQISVVILVPSQRDYRPSKRAGTHFSPRAPGFSFRLTAAPFAERQSKCAPHRGASHELCRARHHYFGVPTRAAAGMRHQRGPIRHSLPVIVHPSSTSGTTSAFNVLASMAYCTPPPCWEMEAPIGRHRHSTAQPEAPPPDRRPPFNSPLRRNPALPLPPSQANSRR